MLAKLLALINSIDPAQVKNLIDVIREIISLFAAKGFVADGLSSGPEKDQVVEACVAKGCSETEARELVKRLPA